MKILKILIPVLVLAVIGIGGYFFMAQTTQQEPATIEVRPIESDNEYSYTLALTLKTYADARLLFAQIVNVDVESIGAYTWKEWIDTNQEQWEFIEYHTPRIVDYIEKSNTSDTSSIFDTALAQGLPEYKMEPMAIEEESPFITTDFSDGPDRELEFDRKLEFDETIDNEIIKVAHGAKQGEILKDIMKKMGTNDAVLANDWLNQANDLHFKYQDDIEKLNAEREKLAAKIRDSAIFAASTGIAVGGIYVAGTKLFFASGTAGLSHLATSAGLTFSSYELLLASGEHGSYLMDSKGGQQFFQSQSEEFNKTFRKVKFALVAYNLAKLKFPTQKDFSADDIPDFVDNVKNVINLPENMVKFTEDRIKEGSMFMVDIPQGDETVTIGLSKEAHDAYQEAKDNPEEFLKNILPPGTYIVDGKPFSMPGLQKVSDIKPEEFKDELPEADIPDAPSMETLMVGTYSANLNFVEKVTGIPMVGTMNFTIDENGKASGSFNLTSSGTITQSAGEHTVETFITGSANGSFEGEFDWESQSILMNGTYSGGGTSTTMGQSYNSTDTGSVAVEGVVKDGKFIGNTSLFSTLGFASNSKFTTN